MNAKIDRFGITLFGGFLAFWIGCGIFYEDEPVLEMGYQVQPLKAASSPEDVRQHIEKQLAGLNNRGGKEGMYAAQTCGVVGTATWSGNFKKNYADGSWTFTNNGDEGMCWMFQPKPAGVGNEVAMVPGFPVASLE